MISSSATLPASCSCRKVRGGGAGRGERENLLGPGPTSCISGIALLLSGWVEKPEAEPVVEFVSGLLWLWKKPSSSCDIVPVPDDCTPPLEIADPPEKNRPLTAVTRRSQPHSWQDDDIFRLLTTRRHYRNLTTLITAHRMREGRDEWCRLTILVVEEVGIAVWPNARPSSGRETIKRLGNATAEEECDSLVFVLSTPEQECQYTHQGNADYRTNLRYDSPISGHSFSQSRIYAPQYQLSHRKIN